MARSDHIHTRVVTWLKIALPLVALALLSTLFLLSRPAAPPDTLPFADADLSERASKGQVTAPFYSGMTEDGALVSFRAAAATPDTANVGNGTAFDVFAEFDMADGSRVSIEAKRLRILDSEDKAILSGEVVLTNNAGYRVLTDELRSRFSVVDIESAGPVSGSGPVGTFAAGRMHITGNAAGEPSHLLFTDGIKLVYDPKTGD